MIGISKKITKLLFHLRTQYFNDFNIIKNKIKLNIIESLDNLKYLDCSNSNLIELTFVSNSLKKLKCSNNNLTEMNNLPCCLEFLDCSHNQITNLNFLPENLKYLNCSYNKLKYLDDLPNSIKYLITTKNNIINYLALPIELIQLNNAKFDNSISFQKNRDLISNYKKHIFLLNYYI